MLNWSRYVFFVFWIAIIASWISSFAFRASFSHSLFLNQFPCFPILSSGIFSVSPPAILVFSLAISLEGSFFSEVVSSGLSVVADSCVVVSSVGVFFSSFTRMIVRRSSIFWVSASGFSVVFSGVFGSVGVCSESGSLDWSLLKLSFILYPSFCHQWVVLYPSD